MGCKRSQKWMAEVDVSFVDAVARCVTKDPLRSLLASLRLDDAWKSSGIT